MKFEIINKLKKEKGLTNAQIASQAGVTLSTLDKITAGINTNPKLDTLQAICKVLGCRLDDFDDNNPKIETDFLKEKLLRNYDSMNKEGRDRLIAYSEDLVASGNYKVAYMAARGMGEPRPIVLTKEEEKEMKEAPERDIDL